MTDDKHCNRCANAVNRPEIINSKAGEAHERSWDEWCGKGECPYFSPTSNKRVVER